MIDKEKFLKTVTNETMRKMAYAILTMVPPEPGTDPIQGWLVKLRGENDELRRFIVHELEAFRRQVEDNDESVRAKDQEIFELRQAVEVKDEAIQMMMEQQRCYDCERVRAAW